MRIVDLWSRMCARVCVLIRILENVAFMREFDNKYPSRQLHTTHV